MARGNQVVDVIVAKACGLIWLLTVDGNCEISVAIGLYPRKAANKASVGGISDRDDAI